MTLPDLSPDALARIAPDLTLGLIERLAEPPLPHGQLSRLRHGRFRPTAATVARIEAALKRARELASRGELPARNKGGRPKGSARNPAPWQRSVSG